MTFSTLGPEPSETLIGISGAHGVVIAPAVVMGTERVRFRRRRVQRAQMGGEKGRYQDAVRQVQSELRDKVGGLDDGGPEASILEAYILMVGDPVLAAEVEREIEEHRRCAEWAVDDASTAIASRLGAVDDPYMRERRHDIEFVG
ncbi:MAG: phosphoenolpyruvate-utilizing N-terminal domain-containing protein, partial [Myxococcota bacterium]